MSFKGNKLGPRIAGTHGSIVDDALRERARSFVAHVGVVKARALLRTGADALDAVCHRGNVMPQTAQRIREALDREEAVLAQQQRDAS